MMTQAITASAIQSAVMRASVPHKPEKSRKRRST
jgi:hypothetical protein